MTGIPGKVGIQKNIPSSINDEDCADELVKGKDYWVR